MDVKSWLYVASSSLAIGAVIYSWFTARSKANTSAITSLVQRVEELELRQARLNERLEALPKIRAEMSEVNRRMDSIGGAVENANGQLNVIGKTLNMINNHLISGN